MKPIIGLISECKRGRAHVSTEGNTAVSCECDVTIPCSSTIASTVASRKFLEFEMVDMRICVQQLTMTKWRLMG